jgi:hypothetical protein
MAFDPDQARGPDGRWIAGAASSATKTAKEGSRAAKKGGTAEGHRSAAESHKKAAKGHRELARRNERLGNAAAAKAHASLADQHKERAADHAEKARAIGAAKTSLKSLGIKSKGISETTKANAEAAIVKGGYQAYLAREPLKRVREHEGSGDAEDRDSHANGLYLLGEGKQSSISLKTTEAFEVTHARAERIYKDKPRVLGDKVHSVSSLASSPEKMQQATMIHELGHHIHLNNRDPLSPALNREIENAYHSRVSKDEAGKRVTSPGAWVPSSYSRANHKEWFAETHAAYVLYPETLKAKDPSAYKLMTKVRKARGMG